MSTEERSLGCPRPEALAGADLEGIGDGQGRDSAAVGNLGSAGSDASGEPAFVMIPEAIKGWDSGRNQIFAEWEFVPFDFEAHAAGRPELIMRSEPIRPHLADPHPVSDFKLAVEPQRPFSWLEHPAMTAVLKRLGKAHYVGPAGAALVHRSSLVQSVILHNSLTDENG